METISGCRLLEVNMKAKIYIYGNSTIQRCPNKIIKFFWLKIFSICHRRQRLRWCTLSREYLREFSKKFEMTVRIYSVAWGNYICEKNQKSKISWLCPFKVLRGEERMISCSLTVWGCDVNEPGAAWLSEVLAFQVGCMQHGWVMWGLTKWSE
jgi:hypothetical protein